MAASPSPVEPSSAAAGVPTRTPSQASTSRSVRTAASLRGPNNHQAAASGSYAPSAYMPSTSEHSEFGAAPGSSAAGPSTYYRPSTPLELHQPAAARSTTPQPSLSTRPGTAMSTHSSRHARTASSGRYPAFSPSDTPSVHTTSGERERSDRPPPPSSSRFRYMSKGEMSFVPDVFDYPMPDEAEFDGAFESFIPEVLSQTGASLLAFLAR